MTVRTLSNDTFQIDVPWSYDPRTEVIERKGKKGLWLRYRLPNCTRRYVRVSENRQSAERQRRRKREELDRGVFEKADLALMPEIGIRRLEWSEAVETYYELPPRRPRKGQARKISPGARRREKPGMRILCAALQTMTTPRLQYVDELTDGAVLQGVIEGLMRQHGFSETTGNKYIGYARKMLNRFIQHGCHFGPNQA